MSRSSQSLEVISVASPIRLRSGKSHLKYLALTVTAGVAFACLLQSAGYLMISTDPLPTNAPGAVVLQGSFLGERARLAGAVQLLQQGTVDRILLGVPHESYWGQPLSPQVKDYIARKYGDAVASHTDICEADPAVDSTEEEAEALSECIRGRGWNSFVLVTSEYHTRRAGIIWRRVLRNEHLQVNVIVHGVTDPEYQPRGWWKSRRSAKTWFMEFVKLCPNLVSLH